jgi:hypothetical protein
LLVLSFSLGAGAAPNNPGFEFANASFEVDNLSVGADGLLGGAGLLNPDPEAIVELCWFCCRGEFVDGEDPVTKKEGTIDEGGGLGELV